MWDTTAPFYEGAIQIMMLPESGIKVYPYDVDIQATSDVPLQMFLLQWHTPAPISAQDKIDPVVAATRCALLERFRDWLIAEMQQHPADSPVFIIAPELSMPQKCWSVLDEITKQIDRQTIIIAGFEYLDWTEYTTLLTENAFSVPDPDMWIAGGMKTTLLTPQEFGFAIKRVIFASIFNQSSIRTMERKHFCTEGRLVCCFGRRIRPRE